MRSARWYPVVADVRTETGEFFQQTGGRLRGTPREPEHRPTAAGEFPGERGTEAPGAARDQEGAVGGQPVPAVWKVRRLHRDGPHQPLSVPPGDGAGRLRRRHLAEDGRKPPPGVVQ